MKRNDFTATQLNRTLELIDKGPLRDAIMFGTLMQQAGVFLRGMNMVASGNREIKENVLRLWKEHLYPYMLDSFEWVNDKKVVFSSKRELQDDAGNLGIFVTML